MLLYTSSVKYNKMSGTRRPEVRGSAHGDAGSGRAEDARQQVAQVAACRVSRLRGRSAAAGALGSAAGALGGASDRVGARIGSPPVGPHFS